jgi:hypothetical protein
MSILEIRMENKNWMALFDAHINVPNLAEDKNKIINGHRIMYEGINKKIKYSQDIQDAFFELFQIIIGMPDDVIDAIKDSQSGLAKAILEFNSDLNGLTKSENHCMFIAFNFTKNKTNIIISFPARPPCTESEENSESEENPKNE